MCSEKVLYLMNSNTTCPIGWNFDNSYLQLPANCYTRINPVPVDNPQVVIFNYALANTLGLTVDKLPDAQLAALFSGNILPDEAAPLAQAYAGHQFGHFTLLGDGRAHLLGEHITPDKIRFDIQLKGSGKTPYGKRGDGRAAIGPMLREYILSEAMYALGIPTTRSLAVITTGEPVYRQTVLQGAVLTRIASSHLRIGTFEYLARQNDIASLKQVTDYTIARHYPHLQQSLTPYADLIKAVMARQMTLVIHWLRVGFIHGVMNTDNMAISGETIDYGPCAFLDVYNPQKVFSSIDHRGRYAYANQPHIVQWNLARFAEALLPLLHVDVEQAVQLAEEIIESFGKSFHAAWLSMMRRKLGLFDEHESDEALIGDLLKWMQHTKADYTNTFRDLISKTCPTTIRSYTYPAFQNWWGRWQTRVHQQQNSLPDTVFALMRANNPSVIPRNHQVEKALSMVQEQNDNTALHTLLEVLATPYDDSPRHKAFQKPPKPEEQVHQTFCGT